MIKLTLFSIKLNRLGNIIGCDEKSLVPTKSVFVKFAPKMAKNSQPVCLTFKL